MYDPPWSPWCSGDFYLSRQFPEMHARRPAGFVPNPPNKTRVSPVPKFTVKQGAIASGQDLQDGTFTVAAAEVQCTALPDCGGFTFKANSSTPAGTVHVYFKDVGDGINTDSEWFSYINSNPLPPGLTLPHAPYARPAGSIVHAWRPGHWYTWMFEVDKVTEDGEWMFGAGGNQGGEGSDIGGEWFIEGALEELDAENEFFYDKTTQLLHLYYNGTGPPPTDATFVVPTLANMIEVRADQQYPARNISLFGLKMSAARPTFMEPRGNPSGGDWALERLGALLVEGAVDMRVSGCLFSRLDGNAIMLSGYNRRVMVDHNHFEWLGQNALASWGKSNFNDGTNGDQPRGTVFSHNLATEVGIIQKQSSMYFQAETAQATIENNICFNIPRAAINFNE